jgi:hypothetical protein
MKNQELSNNLANLKQNLADAESYIEDLKSRVFTHKKSVKKDNPYVVKCKSKNAPINTIAYFKTEAEALDFIDKKEWQLIELVNERKQYIKDLQVEIAVLENQILSQSVYYAEKYFIPVLTEEANRCLKKAEEYTKKLCDRIADAQWYFRPSFENTIKAQELIRLEYELKTKTIEEIMEETHRFLNNTHNVRTESTCAIRNECSTMRYKMMLEISHLLHKCWNEMTHSIVEENNAKVNGK